MFDARSPLLAAVMMTACTAPVPSPEPPAPSAAPQHADVAQREMPLIGATKAAPAPAPPPDKPAHVFEVQFGTPEMTACARKLVQATEKVLQSPAFAANLKRYGAMFDMPRQKQVPSAQIFSAYFGLEAATGGPGPLPALIVRGSETACAKPRPTPLGSSSVAVTDVFRCGHRALTQVSDFVVYRWYSKGDVEPTESKACAINTIAHELTHAVVAKPVGPKTAPDHLELYQDGDHRSLPHDVSLVSYTTGSIAQCTYMADKGLIGGADGGTAADFDACVKLWGTMDFFVSKKCEQFDNEPLGAAPCPELL
jgi:hypothetical protein